jgi:hypothetical protein
MTKKETLVDDLIAKAKTDETRPDLYCNFTQIVITNSEILLAKFRRYQFNLTVARRAGEIKGWAAQNRRPIGLADLIIAATAEYYRVDIVTGNARHFDSLPLNGVQIISTTGEHPDRR